AATVGKLSLVIIISSEVEGQTPLAIVQRKVFAPTPIAVKPDVGELIVVITPLPDIKVQVPVPTAATFPASVPVVAQMVWSVPAAATVGKLSRFTVTSSEVE